MSEQIAWTRLEYFPTLPARDGRRVFLISLDEPREACATVGFRQFVFKQVQLTFVWHGFIPKGHQMVKVVQ